MRHGTSFEKYSPHNYISLKGLKLTVNERERVRVRGDKDRRETIIVTLTFFCFLAERLLHPWALPGCSHDSVSLWLLFTAWLTVTSVGTCIYDFQTPTQFWLSMNMTHFQLSNPVSCLHPRIAFFRFTPLEYDGSV